MPSESQERYQIFNVNQEQGNHAAGHQSFALFSQLPEDLRLQIWRTSLQHERMIQICIHPILGAGVDSGGISHIPQPRYRAAVRGHRVLSKLFRVSHEARGAALAFFRVQIPCTFTRTAPKQALATVSATPGHNILPFNPEHNVLQLSASFWSGDSNVKDFLLDLKALDTRGVGLRKLAIDVDDWPLRKEEANKSSSPSLARAESRTADLRALFAGLNEVLFTTTVSLGRILVPARPRRDDSQREVLFLNRAMPVCAHTPTFTRVPRDPRPVATVDLRRVYTADGLGPRARALAMRALLVQLGAQPGDMCAIRMGWLLAFKPTKEVQSLETAEEFVGAEGARWAGEGPVLGPSLADDLERLSNRYLYKDSHEADQRHVERDILAEDLKGAGDVIFGYWLFPLDYVQFDSAAAEEAEEEGNAWEFEHEWVTRPLHDFSKCLPELIMMDLT